MSFLYFKTKIRWKSFPVYLVLLLTILFNISEVRSISCDEVASIPPSIDILLPQYERLKRIHLSNFFFLEDKQGKNGVEPHVFSISIHKKSLFKMQVIPKHSGIVVGLKINSMNTILETSPNIPIDFTEYEPISPGTVKISFTPIANYDDEIVSDLRHKSVHDPVCDEPYMHFEIYIEEYENFNERIPLIQKDVEKYNEIGPEVDTLVNKIIDLQTAYFQSENINKVKNIKLDLNDYKLTLPHGDGLQHYWNYNISVLHEWDINIPEEEIDTSKDYSEKQFASLYHKYSIKFQLFIDFFLGGNLHLLLIRTKDIHQLSDLNCISEGSCLISEVPHKNSKLLEAILTSGDYKLLLVNMNMNNYLAQDSKNLRKSLKLDAIPLSGKFKIKKFFEEENRYNCVGRHLPSNFDYLLYHSKLKLNDLQQRYFEYQGEIIINLEDMRDSVEFTIAEDSFIRVATFHDQGINVSIELYELNEVRGDTPIHIIPRIGFGGLAKSLNEAMNLLNGKKETHENEVVFTLTKSKGENNGLIHPLYKNRKYRLVFNYENSMFEENERKTCEMFYVKIGIELKERILKTLPKECNKANTLIEVDNLLEYLEKNHLSKNEENYTTPNPTIVPLRVGEKNTLIYQKNFEIKESINVNIEVISDFVSSYIIPVIIPLDPIKNIDNNLDDLLHHKFKMLTLHDNSIKVKLNKGKYMLILMNGISQLYSNDEFSRLTHPISGTIKCMSFKISMSSINVSGAEKFRNWECNNVHYSMLPKELNLLINSEKRHFTYHNKHLLLPGYNSKRPFISTKIKTSNYGFYMRLVGEYRDKHNLIIDSAKVLQISLIKNNKVLQTAYPKIIEKELKTDQQYLNYFLESHSEYELKIESDSEFLQSGWSYFEYCRLFKLEINMIREDALKAKAHESCVENTPKLEDVIYERIIGTNDSFYKYGTKTPLEIFTSYAASHIDNKHSHKNRNDFDLEYLHPRSSLFIYKFDPNITKKQNSFKYDFEIKSNYAMVTVLLEVPYSSLVGFSFKVLRKLDDVHELVAIDDMEEEGLLSIRGLLLETGKYTVIFFPNTSINKLHSNFFKQFNSLCATFSASVLIENKPFEFLLKGLSENYETCPYLSFPTKLNIPGWVGPDTAFTLNENFRFKLKKSSIVNKFSVKEQSIFKFYIPDEYSGLFSYISLYKIKANKQRHLIETFEKENNFINTIIPKGTFRLEFKFKLVDDSELNETANKCQYYDVHIAIIPVSNIISGVDSFNRNNCDEKYLNYNNNDLKPDTSMEFTLMAFRNLQIRNDQGTYDANVKKIKLLPSKNKGKFIGELIFNNYIDGLYDFVVYKNKLENGALTEVPSEVIHNENFVWVFFHFEKDTEYILQIISGDSDSFSNCSDVRFSYSYEEYSDDKNPLPGHTEEYLYKKDRCGIEDHLPHSFFNNHNNILDKYGGPQSPVTGELNFFGEFLLPKTMTKIRSDFLIMQKSILFIKIIPKYQNAKSNYIQIEVFKEKNILFRMGHNEFKGIFMYELDHSPYDFLGNTSNKQTLFFLDITFDKILSDCESFEFVFNIIPKDQYIEEYLSCEGEKQTLPDQLTLDKISQFNYVSNLKLSDSNSQFKKDEEEYLEKSIKLVLTNPTSVDIVLDYIISDNMMDIVLEKEEDQEDFDVGQEILEHASNSNGISVKKEISVDLKKGAYLLKIVYHQIFSQILKKFFSNEVNNLCFGFELNIEAYPLTNLKNEYKFSNKDDNDPEIHNLLKEDFKDSLGKNYITLINPPEKKNIKLNSKFNIEIKFAFDLENMGTSNSANYNKMIYLQDVNSKSSGGKIYAVLIKDLNKKSINFVFDTSRDFTLKTCYKILLEESFKSKFNDDTLQKLKDTYCMINCECNSNASYKCSKNDKCVCHHPYTGPKCENCMPGFAMNIHKKCVDESLLNIKCDDKKTCSGHGTCIVENFDAYAVSSNTALHPCKCDEGFASYNAPFGYAISNFCNSCKNPGKSFPFCSPKHGSEESDSLEFTFDSGCNESQGVLSLPPRLYGDESDEDSSEKYGADFAYFDGGQDVDGSLDLLAIYQVKQSEEITEIIIPEDSVIRVFYESREINRAKIMILENKYDQEAIAYTDGINKTESFIAKLDHKESPYYIKIMHNNLKTQCNKYRLKIVIKTFKVMLSELKCKSHININNLSSLLPASNIEIGNVAGVYGSDTLFYIPDNLIFLPSNKNKKEAYDYTHSGVLSKATINEEFVYNIRVEIKSPVTFSANVIFDFLESDFTIALRDNSSKILKDGEWLIPDENFHTGDHDFINELNTLLDPGVYYLTISQNISANHIMQIIYENENLTPKKGTNKVTNSHILRCFRFKLNIQTIPINKPDPSLSTAKYESMFNRLINVEPESFSNINVKKKFEIFLSFEAAISSVLNTKGYEKRSQKLTFRDAFYLENSRTKEKITPSHAYLQGTLSKTFLIIYEENVLVKDECYELKYNLDILQSSYDKDRKVTSDFPIIHKFCTKACDCNSYTDFECDEKTGKCICEEPYEGEGCFNCMEGWVMMRGKCITQQNCRNKFCTGHGNCVPENGFVNSSKQISKSKCECDIGFSSRDCSTCLDSNMIYPDCHVLTKDSKEGKTDIKDIGKFIKLDNQEFTEIDNEIYKCEHPFIPHNLDTLGYLHLDGNMHISGKYSLKHINKKHYTMTFTIKERSHIKLFLEHTKVTHVVAVFLLDNFKKVLHNGTIDMGPAGYGSTTYIDFIVDPLKNLDNTFTNYEIKIFIKDFPFDENDMSIQYDSDENLDSILDECFTVFMEMEIMSTEKEQAMITALNSQSPKCSKNQENVPKFFAELSNFDSHILDYNKVDQPFLDYTHIRKNNFEVSGSVFFHYEYIYIPDLLDKEFIMNMEIYSKFLNSQVGVILEILEIPSNEIKIKHKKLTAKMIEDIVEKNNQGKRISYPKCEIHCFSGIKKFNSVYFSRVLPSDTFARVWLYDLEPVPKNLSSVKEIPFNKCLDFEAKVYFIHLAGNDKSLENRNYSALCVAKDLPSDLNNKEYLGDPQYIKKWGFHVLDYFRIDQSIDKGLKHETFFKINEFHLLRLYVFNGRIDTDLEVFSIHNDDHVLIARSSAKNFEDVIVIEIPPGSYKIEFKFYPPLNGFHKCESIKMEFSMNSFALLQPKIDNMVARQTTSKFRKIDISEHLSQYGKDILAKDPLTVRYLIETFNPFTINVDDPKNYESSISISDFTFIIEPEDDKKLELIAFVSSDFLYLDANVYLSTFTDNGDKNSKIIAGRHKKNLNLLFSGTLEAGTYVMSIRYYRRLRFKKANDNTYDKIILKKGNMAEIEFDAMFVNKSKDNVNILTSNGYIKIPPASNNSNSISHNWFCRSAGLPIPKSLSSLRFLEFSSDSHILGNYLVPAMGLGKETIKFRLNTPGMMIRVYVECHDVDIDIKLVEKNSKGDSVVISRSKENIHFETIMELVSENRDYEIVLKFKGLNNAKENSNENLGNACLTFKMEIAVEKQHNYACPINSKYSALTDLQAIPSVLPAKDKDGKKTKIYRYDSKTLYLGDSKNSGFVYMIRKDEDETIKYSEFTVASEIDLKVEITNDFLQAPVNIFLTASADAAHPNVIANVNKFGLAKKALHIEDAFIIAYGEINENRSTLLIKNLPKGSYILYLYLPKLRSKFEFNPRVCSIYDILVEAKKSRNHFREKEIVRISDVEDEVLDPPVFLPDNLNNFKFLKGEEHYVNYMDYSYMHHLASLHDNQLVNRIDFKLKEESAVTFYVYHDLFKESIEVLIEGHTHESEMINTVLKPGDYKAVIKLKNLNIKNETVKHQHKSNHFLILLYIGIAPIKRVTDIYSYNNLQSAFRQCTSTKFPTKLDYDETTQMYSFSEEFFKFSKQDLTKLKLGEFTVNLTNSNSNRILVEIGSDYTLNQLNVKVKSENKKWNTSWKNNVGDLDILVPQGLYTFEFELDEPIILDNLECIIFSVNIHILNNNLLKELAQNAIHPAYSIHAFTSSGKENKLLAPKCEGSMLPLEIHSMGTSDYHKINQNGDYLLHINKALYFVDRQHSLNNENLNEVDINLEQEVSIIRIRTLVEKPHEYQIIPKMKIYSEMESPPTVGYLNPNLSYISHNMMERNNIWFLEKNKHHLKEFYILDLIQEKYEAYTPTSLNYHCPTYTLDILIQSVSELASRLECPTSSNHLLVYKLPITDIPSLKQNVGSKLDNFKSYHEKIEFGYFTENQFSASFITNESFTGFQYGVKFSVEGEIEYHLNLEFGHDQVVSLFDVYLSKYEDNDVFENRVIAVSEPYFDKGNVNLPYKRILNAQLTKGKYVILIVENVWENVSRSIKVLSKNESINLCLPFSYSLDIIPANDKTSAPEIISVFPPGPISFKSIDEDLNVKIILSKPPFTKNHQPITHINNFMNIINSFYLIKRETNKSAGGNTNFNQEKFTKIYPSKMEGSANNKEWVLLFLKDHFEANFDYQLGFDNNWLYDVNYSPFKSTKSFPIFRVEVNKESIFQMVDNIKQMKTKMNDTEFTEEKETPKEDAVSNQATSQSSSTPITKQTKEETSKCGVHGKLIYDNILRKTVCTCFDGFTGKFCNICDGTYDKKLNKCIVIEDDDDDNDSTKLNEPPSEIVTSPLYTTGGHGAVSDTTVTFKSCNGGCVNGYCDTKVGKCVCEINWTGPRCDRPTKKSSNSVNKPEIKNSLGLFSILIKSM